MKDWSRYVDSLTTSLKAQLRPLLDKIEVWAVWRAKCFSADSQQSQAKEVQLLRARVKHLGDRTLIVCVCWHKRSVDVCIFCAENKHLSDMSSCRTCVKQVSACAGGPRA